MHRIALPESFERSCRVHPQETVARFSRLSIGRLQHSGTLLSRTDPVPTRRDASRAQDAGEGELVSRA